VTGEIGRQFRQRRLWGSVILALATALLEAIHGEVGGHVYGGVWSLRLKLVELALATLVLFGFGSALMARGSPGMEADIKGSHDVRLFQPNGRYAVYPRYGTR
jgi:hypothetical protein